MGIGIDENKLTNKNPQQNNNENTAMKNTNLNIKSVKLQRTLVIAIGGSGAEVMISNRRRTIDQFGSLEAMPLVRYLYIDTDPRWFQEHLSKVEQRVRISEPEYVDIQFPGASELYRGIRRGSYRGDTETCFDASLVPPGPRTISVTSVNPGSANSITGFFSLATRTPPTRHSQVSM